MYETLNIYETRYRFCKAFYYFLLFPKLLRSIIPFILCKFQDTRATKTEIRKGCSSLHDSIDLTVLHLPPLENPFAKEQLRNGRKTTLFEALHMEADYEADTEDDDIISWNSKLTSEEKMFTIMQNGKFQYV